MMSAQLQQQQPPENQLSSNATLQNGSVQTQPVSDEPLRNCAAESRNPYIRTFSDSPVAWQLLQDRAISRARSENKPIFLSIGFVASHQCHLVRQEALTNPRVASLLNENFIPILIDREEYPTIDSLFLNYNKFINNCAGWPLNIFLTPDMQPFYGGSHWIPPGAQNSADEQSADTPFTWLSVIEKVLSSWKNEEDRVREEARNTWIQLRQVASDGSPEHPLVDTPSPDFPPPDYSHRGQLQCEVDLDQLEEAYERITRTFDPAYGGFGQEAKFLFPSKLSFMLRATQFPQVVQDVVGPNESAYVSIFALHTLRRIIDGAIHDHIGGGFHRHSITRDWSLPSFEKLLADNALLLGVLLDAWLLSGGTPQSEFAGIVLEVADYLTSETMLSAKGGFHTSEWAASYNKRGDVNMRNGAFYLWTRREFDEAIGDETEAEIAGAYWDVREDGNVDPTHDPHDEFLNQNVIRIVENTARLSRQLGMAQSEIQRHIQSAKEKLARVREKERVRPEVDTKVVTSYNGMAIAALARTAAALFDVQPEKSARYLKAAKDAASFIKAELWDGREKTLYRIYYDDGRGRGDVEAVAEDYAFLVEGLIELYEATANEDWLEWADALQDTQVRRFYDHAVSEPSTAAARSGGFYSTELHHHDRPSSSSSSSSSPSAAAAPPRQLLRCKEAMDGTQPSVNAVSAANLLRLAALLGRDAAGGAGARYDHLARATANAFGVEMLEHPQLFPGLLCSIVPWKLVARRAAAAHYHRRPRGGLLTLRHHDPEGEDGGGGGGGRDSWLQSRCPVHINTPGIYTDEGELVG
ncbi:spermatogenesis-associated protein [Xylariaceae sp. FL0804]|nr:spermatogenesis-associated protein [Xylariaceae sp. FL0804]